VGRGGERIKTIENEVGARLRLLEMTLDFKQWIRAVHPVGWISKHIADADFAGPELLVQVKEERVRRVYRPQRCLCASDR